MIRRQQQVSSVGAVFPMLWDPEVLEQLHRSAGRSRGRSAPPRTRSATTSSTSRSSTRSPRRRATSSSSPGMLTATRTRSELAGVFAHEIAHVQAGHYERLSRRSSLGAVPALAAIILSGGNPAVIYGALALLESYQLAFSREMETEADRLSVIYLRRTSFDSHGLIGSLRLIEQGERLVPAGGIEGLRSHPLTVSRITELQSSLGLAPGRSTGRGPTRSGTGCGPSCWPTATRRRRCGSSASAPRSAAPLDHDLLGVVHLRRGDPGRPRSSSASPSGGAAGGALRAGPRRRPLGARRRARRARGDRARLAAPGRGGLRPRALHPRGDPALRGRRGRGDRALPPGDGADPADPRGALPARPQPRRRRRAGRGRLPLRPGRGAARRLPDRPRELPPRPPPPRGGPALGGASRRRAAAPAVSGERPRPGTPSAVRVCYRSRQKESGGR